MNEFERKFWFEPWIGDLVELAKVMEDDQVSEVTGL
jgi:hypothetical protein